MENGTEGEISIAAVFRYELYYSPRWQICKYRDRDRNTVFVAAGVDLPRQRNLCVELYGKWTKNRRDGKQQFLVTRYERAQPSSEQEITAYLSSLKCGVGSIRAKAIIRHFGADTWTVLENEPQRLAEVPGIGKIAAEKIRLAIRKGKAAGELERLFSGAGMCLSGNMLRTLTALWGNEAAAVLEKDPYLGYLEADIPFDKADALALSRGFRPDSPRRLSAMAAWILNDAATGGHVCLPKETVLGRLISRSGETEKACKDGINEACRSGILRCSHGCLYTPGRLGAERNICGQLIRLLNSGHSQVSAAEPLLRDYGKSSFPLAECQRDAVLSVFSSSVSIITGGPGVGKTTVSRAILAVHSKVYGRSSRPMLLAPTGKAAGRLSEATSFPAETIHSAIGWRGEGMPCPDMVLDANLILVDEASMMDQQVFSLLLSRIGNGCRLVLTGDADQLPSVGCGNVLRDLIDSGVIPVTRLSVIFRQAEDNPIIRNIHAVNEGRTDLLETETFRFVETESEEQCFSEAVRIYLRCVEQYGEENVLLLNPQRNNTELSVDRLNAAVQAALNPSKDSRKEIALGKVCYRVGDRVMQLRNSEFARNGDTGHIRDIFCRPLKENPEETEQVAEIEFNPDGRRLEYRAEDLRTITHAWCTTVHKAQGSEYRTVIQIISGAHPSMLKRQIVYTGLSRSRENVIIIGEREAFAQAVRNRNREYRCTLLAQRLAEKGKHGAET